MATQTVYFRGSYAQAREISQRLARIIAGQSDDAIGIARGVNLAIGVAALSDIKADFVRKARGGTGEDGVKWPPLSQKYLAYGRRFGPGEKAALKKAAGLGRANRFGVGENTGLLTAAQLKRWKSIFRQVMLKAALSMGETEAKAKAAAIAWATLKREGAKTKLEVFGNRQVEILRDTGILLNSLSPGQLGGGALPTSYNGPTDEGGDMQILRTVRDGVFVGTTVPYAGVHQHGSTTKNIPARPFLPRSVPAKWLARWNRVANQALAVGAKILYERSK